MILDFLVWSVDNDPHYRVGPNILVITKDIFGKKTTFLSVLRSLEVAYYHVLWALPDDDHTTEPPPWWVKSKWHWRILSGGGDPPINETESSPSVGDKRKSRDEDIEDIGHNSCTLPQSI